MNLVDFILNVAGLLFWLNWRAIHLSPIARPGSSLVATLRTATPPPPRWLYFGMLVGLLVVRAFFYWQIGSALPWTPRLSLEATTLVFHSQYLGRMLLFSTMSFGAALGVFYLWLVFLSCVNANASENDSEHRLVQLQLGAVKNWPSVAKMVLPFMAAVLIWVFVHPILAGMQIVPKSTFLHVVAQGAVIGLGVYLQLKYLLIGLLVLHLINSYVYLGSSTIWDYINKTSNNLLHPLRWRGLSLVIKRFDFAPVIAVGLVVEICFVVEWIGRKGAGLPQLFQRFMG